MTDVKLSDQFAMMAKESTLDSIKTSLISDGILLKSNGNVVSALNPLPVSVSNFPSTQVVSGAITANIGVTNGLALDTTVNGLLKPSSTLSAIGGINSTVVVKADATGNQTSPFIVAGQAAVGAAQTANPVDVSGVDGSGLKRSLLTDDNGRLQTRILDSAQTSFAFTSINDSVVVDLTGYQSYSVQITSVGSNNTLIFESRDDDNSSSWSAIPVMFASGGRAAPYMTNSPTISGAGSVSGTGQYAGYRRGKWLRIRPSVYGSGTISGTLTLSTTNQHNIVFEIGEGALANLNPIVFAAESRTSSKNNVSSGAIVRPIATQDGRLITRLNAIPENEWSYAAASGGITNTTTAVTIKSAAASGVRNYITSIQIHAESLTNATELVIRDGAGTVIWRTKIGTTGLPLTNIRFDDPIKSTAATLLEVATLTATGTGSVYFNVQGYIAP